MKRGRQGFFFRVRLGKETLSLWFLGVIPLGVVRLKHVVSISQTFRSEFWSGGAHRIFCPWRYWVWPGTPPGPQAKHSIFLLETRGGTRIWLRLRAGLHYQLREAVHAAGMRAQEALPAMKSCVK